MPDASTSTNQIALSNSSQSHADIRGEDLLRLVDITVAVGAGGEAEASDPTLDTKSLVADLGTRAELMEPFAPTR